MKIQINNFHTLFSAVIVILFSLINITQADQITTILILSLSIFGLLIFSLVSMADPKVVDFLQKRFGKNLLSALIPLTGLFIVTVAYLVLLHQLTPSNFFISFVYLFVPALLLWYDRHHDQVMTWMNLTAISVSYTHLTLPTTPYV